MRVIDFSDGFTSASAPTGGSSSTVTGSTGSPTAIVAGTGITPTGVAQEIIFVQGSGGAVDITANPQIAAGTASGQKLTLIGCSDTNTVKIEEGTGLRLNGSYTMVNGSVITLNWDGSNWLEESRNDV